GGRAFDFTKRIVRPDGQIRQVRCVGRAATDGALQHFVGTGIDVTEQEQLTEELRRSERDLRDTERELREVLDFAPQLIAVLGRNRERLYANRGALEYLNIGLDEWRQRDVSAEVHPDDAEQWRIHAE